MTPPCLLCGSNPSPPYWVCPDCDRACADVVFASDADEIRRAVEALRRRVLAAADAEGLLPGGAS